MLRRAVLAPLPIAVAACGRLLGFGEDAPPPAPAGDAGAAADVATVVEGGSTSDAPAFCAGFSFCDDFERAEPVGGPWERLESYGEAGIELATDATHAVSPSRSLRVDVSGTAEGGATLVRAVPATARRFEIAFSLLLEQAAPDNVHPVSLAFDDRSWAFFIVDAGGMSLVEQITDDDAGTKPFRATPIGPPTYGTFERLTFIVDPSAGRMEMRRASGAVTTLDLALPHGRMRQIHVGADFAFALPSRHWIDDVAMRWE